MCLAFASGPARSDPAARSLIEAWHARLDELSELQARSQVSFSEGSLAEFGRVAFVLQQVRGLPLERIDKDLVFAAVLAQPPEEFERNLPAMVNYLRLSMTAKLLLPRAEMRQPIFGRRRGMDAVARIAGDVLRFRSEQLVALQFRQRTPAAILTAANLGRFGQGSLVQELEAAVREGERQYLDQRDAAGCAVVSLALALGVTATMFVRRRLARDALQPLWSAETHNSPTA
ncbi:MAG: hypothetical protein M1436_09025 [Acidobacteria bacterium]|nr:hypothetical protein [Acidobacteriota bacterium]